MLVDRAYPKGASVKFFGWIPIKAKGFYYSNAKRSFGRNTAKKLFEHNVVSAGAFALDAEAPHWAKWQQHTLRVLRNGNLFTAEQLALGVMAHLDEFPMEYLPSWCHWPFMDLLRWDTQTRCFTEPYLPHEPLGIMHLTGIDDVRKDRSIKKKVVTETGNTVQISLRNPYYDGERGVSLAPAN
jgi:hypothetical protein